MESATSGATAQNAINRPVMWGIMGCIAAVGLVMAPSVSAAKMDEPQVDYSADSVMESEGMAMKSRVYHSHGKQRQEMGGGEGVVTIIRPDKKVVWQLMGNMYMEMAMDQQGSPDAHDLDVQQRTAMGEEEINGVKTTKYKVIATGKDGKKFGGFFWTTKDGITMKMDLLYKEGKNKDRVAIELSNLKIEKQDPKLFEIPVGYTKNDMGAMMGRGKPAGKPGADEMPKDVGGDGAGGAGMDPDKMMKEMMEQAQ